MKSPQERAPEFLETSQLALQAKAESEEDAGESIQEGEACPNCSHKPVRRRDHREFLFEGEIMVVRVYMGVSKNRWPHKNGPQYTMILIVTSSKQGRPFFWEAPM